MSGLIACTRADLRQRVDDGLFRSDLSFRLRVMEIRLLPLGQRGPDIPKLAEFLLRKSCGRLGRQGLGLTPAALQVMKAHCLPGNAREMANAIERAVIHRNADTITLELLAIESRGRRGGDRLRTEPSPSPMNTFAASCWSMRTH